jgi:Domain of unknown function (DUF4440)
MRALSAIVALVLSVALGPTAASAQAPADAVRAAADAFAKAYGAGGPAQEAVKGLAPTADPSNPATATNDHSALMELFDDRATFAGTLQPFWIRGKGDIGDLWARYFARYPDRRWKNRDQEIQVYDNSVAVETGYAEMHMGGDPTTSVATFMRYSRTWARVGNTWKIINMMVDRLPAEQLPPGSFPPWANTPPRSPATPPR